MPWLRRTTPLVLVAAALGHGAGAAQAIEMPADGGLGGNAIRGRQGLDLVIETLAADVPVIFARMNFWDHRTAADVHAEDVTDGADDAALSVVDLEPIGSR